MKYLKRVTAHEGKQFMGSALSIMFVAFRSYFPSSLTVVHREGQQKSVGRQRKSSRAGQQNI